MTTVNTIDDLIRILREQPEAKETVRREILTEELLALPQEIAAMARIVRSTAETQERTLKPYPIWRALYATPPKPKRNTLEPSMSTPEPSMSTPEPSMSTPEFSMSTPEFSMSTPRR